MVKKVATYTDKNSLPYRLRKKRFDVFLDFLEKIQVELKRKELKILDVGGTVTFWKTFGYLKEQNFTMLNLKINETCDYDNVTLVEGDATNLTQYVDDEFDIVFSNSVIEHVGDFDMQKKMAKETMRVGKYVFIQTPNYFFPIEPHYRFPFFQMFPLSLKIYLTKRYHLRFLRKRPKPLTDEEALKDALSAQLLTKRELKKLYPNTIIINEFFYGFIKSFMAASSV